MKQDGNLTIDEDDLIKYFFTAKKGLYLFFNYIFVEKFV